MSISKINFRKLLPTGMRSTRWGDFVEAFQDTYDEVKLKKVDILLNKYNIDLATDDELKDIGYRFGFDLSIYDGYTSTSHYLKREISTIVKRIKTKTTRTCYTYIDMIFNLIGSLNATSQLNLNTTDYLLYEENVFFIPVYILDQEEDNAYFIDPVTSGIVYSYPIATGLAPLYLDTLEFPTLDSDTFGKDVTRYMIYSYKPKFIENYTDFWSLNTLKALKNDVNQAKRATEVVYYQPLLPVTLDRTKFLNEKIWTSYDESFSRIQSSLLFDLDANTQDIQKVTFGNSTHLILDSGITNVDNEIYAVSGLLNIDYDAAQTLDTQVIQVSNYSGILDFQTLITLGADFPLKSGITEIAFFDIHSGIVAYSTFPQILWDPDSFKNLRVQLTLV